MGPRSGARRKRLLLFFIHFLVFFLSWRRTSSTSWPLSLGLMGNMQKRLSLCSPQVINFQQGAGGGAGLRRRTVSFCLLSIPRRSAPTSPLYITAAALNPPVIIKKKTPSLDHRRSNAPSKRQRTSPPSAPPLCWHAGAILSRRKQRRSRAKR